MNAGFIFLTLHFAKSVLAVKNYFLYNHLISSSFCVLLHQNLCVKKHDGKTKLKFRKILKNNMHFFNDVEIEFETDNFIAWST